MKRLKNHCYVPTFVFNNRILTVCVCLFYLRKGTSVLVSRDQSAYLNETHSNGHSLFLASYKP